MQVLLTAAATTGTPTRLLPDAGQAPGASMIITASKERGGKPSLGASVAMDRLKFPVMMQVTRAACHHGGMYIILLDMRQQLSPGSALLAHVICVCVVWSAPRA